MEDKCLKYILTGGPSCGKTSVLEELNNRDFLTFSEKARKIIKVSLESNSNDLPWENIHGFSEKVFTAVCSDFNTKTETSSIAFTDRSMIDLNAYLISAFQPENELYFQASKKYNFAKTVFFFPIWEEIFNQDTERRESTLQAIQITNKLRDVYLKNGFQLVEMPFLTVKERADYILDYINRKLHV